MTNLIFQFHDTKFSIEVRSRRAFPKNPAMFLSKIFSRKIICSKVNTKVTKMITLFFTFFSKGNWCIQAI